MSCLTSCCFYTPNTLVELSHHERHNIDLSLCNGSIVDSQRSLSYPMRPRRPNPIFKKQICALVLENIFSNSNFSTHGSLKRHHISPRLHRSIVTAYMDDAAVMLVAVLVPCLLTTMAVSTILYRVFYKNWVYRYLRSGPRTGERPSEQQQQQPDQNDDTSDCNQSADVEALPEQGNPSITSSPAKPLFS